MKFKIAAEIALIMATIVAVALSIVIGRQEHTCKERTLKLAGKSMTLGEFRQRTAQMPDELPMLARVFEERAEGDVDIIGDVNSADVEIDSCQQYGHILLISIEPKTEELLRERAEP